MRPTDAFGRARPSESDAPPTFQSPAGPQMAYFLADETAVDASLDQALPPLHRSRDSRKSQSTGKPEAGTSSLSSPDDPPVALESTSEADKPSVEDDSRPTTPSYRSSSTPASHALPSLSQPMTPIMLGTSGPASALSSSSSRRNSLEGSLLEDLGSGAMSTAEEAQLGQSSNMMDSGSAPQLIMPSIKMPSRRPFTEEGKRIGRLKILIAGESGTGKTSLMKAIVQSCVHIVHVDPISPPPVSSLMARNTPRSQIRPKSSKPDLATTQITEIFASTKPYPEWWTDVDDIRILRRRKSLGDSILDRNICFVDTPGHSGGLSSMETITPVVQYIESYVARLCSNSLSDSDLLNLLGGDGGSHVDAVFYIISKELKPVDLQYLKLLAQLTNIIPLIGLADTMTPEQLIESKEKITSQLQEADIRPFRFAMSTEMAAGGSTHTIPYAISSAPGSDHETMDASLLMSPDYVQPLIPTELAALVDQVFSEYGASWLRHSAARKCVQWRSSESPSRPQALYRPLSLPTSAQSFSRAATATSPGGAPTSLALARIADHTQREERLAQIRLANWAADLQRSLANERARYETLARSERAVWLTEKLNECVQEGMLVPVSGRDRSSLRISDHVRQRLAGRGRASSKTLQHQDPLGLLEVAADLKAKSWLALEVLGSLGVIGGLAFWMTKQYWHLEVYEWVANECRTFWYGER